MSRRLVLLRLFVINLAVVTALVPLCYRVSEELYVRKIEKAIAGKGWTENKTAELVPEGPGYNPANSYWVVPYDCRAVDVDISGVVPRARYWSIVAYNRWTMPVDSYYFDETIHKDDQGRYTVRLTTHPAGRANEIDVSSSPRGLVIIRTSLPEDAAAVRREGPTVTPVTRGL